METDRRKLIIFTVFLQVIPETPPLTIQASEVAAIQCKVFFETLMPVTPFVETEEGRK